MKFSNRPVGSLSVLLQRCMFSSVMSLSICTHQSPSATLISCFFFFNFEKIIPVMVSYATPIPFFRRSIVGFAEI